MVLLLRNTFKRLPTLLGLIALLSVYTEYPEQDPTYLVESLRFVQEYQFTDNQHNEYADLINHKYDFKLIKVLDYERRTPPSYYKRPQQQLIIIFLTHGSNGHIYQVPATFNTLYNHTMLMNTLQDEIHYRLEAYTFNFRYMPSAFSKLMLEAEAQYAAKAINYVMKHDYQPNQVFHLLGHSMGGVVNYLAATQMDDFPIEQLSTLISIGSPISGSPQYLNKEVLQILERIAEASNPRYQYLKNRVLHLSLHGGTRDNQIRSELSYYNEKFDFKYQVFLYTDQLKNLYRTIDHNASYYYKYFMDAFVPTLLKILTYGIKLNLLERTILAKRLLTLDDSEESFQSQFHSLDMRDYFVSTTITQTMNDQQVMINDVDYNYHLIFDHKEPKFSDVLIYGSIDRNFDVRISAECRLANNYYVTTNYEINNTRIYYPSNFFELRIPKSVFANYTAPSSSCIIFSEFFSKPLTKEPPSWLENIQNFSPSFDKRTPTLVAPPAQTFSYVRIKYPQTMTANKILDSDVVSSMIGMTFNMDLVDIIEMSQDFETKKAISTVLPLIICVELPEYTERPQDLSDQTVILKYSEKLSMEKQEAPITTHKQIFALNKGNQCIKTHPKRNLLSSDPMASTSAILEVYHYRYPRGRIQAPKITLKPNYHQIMRESVVSNLWVILYLGILMTSIRVLYKSILISRIMPIAVLLSHVIIFDGYHDWTQYLPLRQRLDLSSFDVIIIFLCSLLLEKVVNIAYCNFNFVGKMILKCCCDCPSFMHALQSLITITLMLSLITKTVLFLSVTLVLQFALLETVDLDLFTVQVIIFSMQSDKWITDLWRFFSHPKLDSVWKNDFFIGQRISILAFIFVSWLAGCIQTKANKPFVNKGGQPTNSNQQWLMSKLPPYVIKGGKIVAFLYYTIKLLNISEYLYELKLLNL